MTDYLEELKRRLVVGHKRDGRSVYDEEPKYPVAAAKISEPSFAAPRVDGITNTDKLEIPRQARHVRLPQRQRQR